MLPTTIINTRQKACRLGFGVDFEKSGQLAFPSTTAAGNPGGGNDNKKSPSAAQVSRSDLENFVDALFRFDHKLVSLPSQSTVAYYLLTSCEQRSACCFSLKFCSSRPSERHKQPQSLLSPSNCSHHINVACLFCCLSSLSSCSTIYRHTTMYLLASVTSKQPTHNGKKNINMGRETLENGWHCALVVTTRLGHTRLEPQFPILLLTASTTTVLLL